MAASYVTATGNGATTQYALTFSFLDRDHVHAYKDGVETALWTWVNDALIQFDTAPASAVAIKIARETPTTPLVDFTDGSTLTAADQDTAILQSIYISEEAADAAADALGLNAAGTMWDAESKIIDNVPTPTASDHAATKGYVDTADAATLAAAAASAAAAAASATTASGHATTAAGHVATAAAHVTTAAGHVTAAQTAEENAETAEAAAEAAQAAAEAAAASITFPVPIGSGGTGAITAALARVALGFAAALDSVWTAVSVAAARIALGFPAALDTLWTATSFANARSALGLGSIATQASSSVSITGGSVTGITDVTVADGGTGRSSHTAYAVVCGGTTTTAAQQSIAGVGSAGEVLTSNGAGALPTFQAASGGAFSAYAESSQISMTLGALASFTHGLGGQPKGVQLWLECTTAEHSYSVGDYVAVNPTPYNQTYGVTPVLNVSDTTTVKAQVASTGIGVPVKNTGTHGTITLASWRLRIRCWR